MRLVPDQTKEDCVAKLKAHLAKRGYGDIEVNVSGGYDPTETAEDSALIKAELAAYQRAGVKTSVYPRLSGSWPGFVFTSAPVSLPAGQFGFGSRSATKRLAKSRRGKKGAKGKPQQRQGARLPAGMPDLSGMPPSLRELPPGLGGLDQLPPGFDPTKLKFPKGK